jgi:hypothetical protein
MDCTTGSLGRRITTNGNCQFLPVRESLGMVKSDHTVQLGPIFRVKSDHF